MNAQLITAQLSSNRLGFYSLLALRIDPLFITPVALLTEYWKISLQRILFYVVSYNQCRAWAFSAKTQFIFNTFFGVRWRLTFLCLFIKTVSFEFLLRFFADVFLGNRFKTRVNIFQFLFKTTFMLCTI